MNHNPQTRGLLKLMRKESYTAESMAELARRLGCSRVYLYKLTTFVPDGDKIVERVARNREEAAMVRLDPLLAQLRAQRVKLGITRQELADMLGWNYWTLRNMEVGQNRTTLQAAAEWAQAIELELVLRRPRSTRSTL